MVPTGQAVTLWAVWVQSWAETLGRRPGPVLAWSVSLSTHLVSVLGLWWEQGVYALGLVG